MATLTGAHVIGLKVALGSPTVSVDFGVGDPPSFYTLKVAYGSTAGTTALANSMLMVLLAVRVTSFLSANVVYNASNRLISSVELAPG